KNQVNPDTTVAASAQLVDKKESCRAAGQVGDIGARVAAGDTGKIDQQEEQGQYPKRNAAVDHREDPVVGGDSGVRNGKRDDSGIASDEPCRRRCGLELWEDSIGQHKKEGACQSAIK